MEATEHDVAMVIGQGVIDAADKLSMFAPDCEAKLNFGLDGVEYQVVVTRIGTPTHD